MKLKTRLRKRKQKRFRSRTRKLRGGTVFDNINKAQQKGSSITRGPMEGPSKLVNNKKEFTFYNRYHLGDNIFNLKFFYNISNILKDKGIKIHYLYNSIEISKPDEMNRYVNPETLTLAPMDVNGPPSDAMDAWLGNDINGMKYNPDFDGYMQKYYERIVGQLGLESSGIDTSLYQKEPYLEEIYNKLDPKFKNLDILIINAEPKSGQVVYHKLLFEKMCVELSTKYKVALTTPIEGHEEIPCTFRDNLMLQDIGAVSTHAKYIIAIHSGPVTPCYNDATRQHVKKWIIFADNGIEHNQINCVTLKNDYDYRHIEEHLK